MWALPLIAVLIVVLVVVGCIAYVKYYSFPFNMDD